MIDNAGDDEGGETSAVKSKIQPVNPSDQEIPAHEAFGHYPYRDWCRVCVGGAGRSRRSQTTARGTKKSTCGKHGLQVLHGQELSPKCDSEVTMGATPF